MQRRKRGRSASASARQSKSARTSGGADRRRSNRADQQEKEKAARQLEKSHKLAEQQRAQQQLLIAEQRRLHAEAVAADEQFQNGEDPFRDLPMGGEAKKGPRDARASQARSGSISGENAGNTAQNAGHYSRVSDDPRLRDVPHELLGDTGDLSTDSNNLVLYQNSLRVVAQSLPFYLQPKNSLSGSDASNMLQGGLVMDSTKLDEDRKECDRNLMEMINMGHTAMELPQSVYRQAFQSIFGAESDEEDSKHSRERAQSFGSIFNKHAVSEKLGVIDEDASELLAGKKVSGRDGKRLGNKLAKETMLADDEDDEDEEEEEDDEDDEDDDYAKNYYESDAEEAAENEEQ
eukprot:g498.t1